MAFELPALPYAHSALADRGMSQETLELHHDKHHQAYVTALNGLVDKNADLQGKSLEEIITLAKDKADLAPVFNNAGQHWNHIHFWNALSPKGGQLGGRLEAKIIDDFGSVAAFKDAFKSGRQAESHQDRQWQQSAGDGRRQATAGARCVGTQLLPRLPQPPTGLCQQLPRHAGQL